VTSLPRRGFRALLHRFCGSPGLHEALLQERDFVFCVAACKFDTTSHKLSSHWPALCIKKSDEFWVFFQICLVSGITRIWCKDGKET